MGRAIFVNIDLEVPSSTDLTLLMETNCSHLFSFSPAQRLPVPADTTTVNFTVTYTGTTIPATCSQKFSVTSVSSHNYEIKNPTVYYSAKVSIDKTAVQHPMLLRLSSEAISSTNVGHSIVSNASSVAASYAPRLYQVDKIAVGSNSGNFTATSSYVGTLYYAVIKGGTPAAKVNRTGIYYKNLTMGVTYGNFYAENITTGVNIEANFLVTGLESQTKYEIAIYLNSTVGNSDILFLSFKTSKASNAAAIKMAMSAPLANVTAYTEALSRVLKILPNRIYILTNTSIPVRQQTTYNSSVMKKRYYIYDTLVAPNRNDDSVKPIDLLRTFKNDQSAQEYLLGFIPEYISTYKSPVRQVFNTVPRIRSTAFIKSRTYDTVHVSVSFWNPAFVYAVVLKDSKTMLTSSQVINGLDENNTAVIKQHYRNVTTDRKGYVDISLNLLQDNSNYTVYVSAESPMPYPPRLGLADANVLTRTFTTQFDPNLVKNDATVVETVRREHPQMAAEVDRAKKKAKQQKQLWRGSRPGVIR